MRTLLLLLAMMLSMTTVAFAQNINFEVSSQNFQGTIFSEIAIGDPDINGFRDVYFDGASDSNGSSMYSFVCNNNGDGTLNITSPFNGTSNGVILVKDFDNDGDDDYAKWGATDASGNPIGILMRNNGNGTYTDVTPEDFESMYSARGVAEDFDNDDDDDIVVHGYNGNQYFTHYYENHGNLNFTLKQSFYGIGGGDMVAADIDAIGDSGFIDVIHSGDDGVQPFIFALRNDNGWLTEESLSTELDPTAASSMVLIDINTDGFVDYGGVGGSSAEFKLNDGTGHFPGSQLVVPFNGMIGSKLLAFNADNQDKEELFVAGRNGNSNITRLYKINGDNTFTMVKNFSDSFFGGDAKAVDVNNDGYLDLFCSGNIGGFFPFEEGKTSLYINTTSLGVEDFTQDKVAVYPNPTNGIVNIKLPSDVFVTNYMVTDMSGKQFKVTNNGTEIDLSSLADGMYLLTIYSESGQSITKRIIKN